MKKKEFHAVINRNVTSTSTLQALEEHCKVRIAIEDMRNKDATSAIEDHTAYTVTLRSRLGLGLGVTSAKRPFEEKERTTKRTRICRDSNENLFLISGEKSSNDEFEDDEIVTNPKESGVMSLSPQLQNEDSLSHTPNKRKMNDERIRPSLWTESLDTYIDNVLKELKDTFKSDIMRNIEDKDNRFRLYCEKILMDFYNMVDIFPNLSRKVGERKYIIQNISSLFKFYEVTFGNVSFDWIESHSPASKLTKSPTNSGVRLFDDKEIFHAEVSAHHRHHQVIMLLTAKKSLHTDILNLIAILLDHLRVLVEDATKVKVFSLQVIEYRMTLYSLNMLNDGTFLTSELYSTLLPFSLDAISKYKGILYLMAVLHEEITKQISIMKDFDLAVHHNGKSIVRDVLKIPKGLKELLIIKK
ncbi:unnamed protein product [Rhizophagus irregularis]|uniref:Uncharacterized protein n=1 Tax=Rhizophagus irregularis TaxID=588596 RepID=A0A916EBQ5_9GLOM|nr:unnamed protein product [Rhizophagus irregularis]